MGQRLIISEEERKNIISSHIRYGYVPTLTENEIKKALMIIFESDDSTDKLKEKLQSTISNNFDEDPKKFAKNIVDTLPNLKSKEKDIESGIKKASEINYTKNGIITIVSAILLGLFANQIGRGGVSKDYSNNDYGKSKTIELTPNSTLKQYDTNGDGLLDDYEIEMAAKQRAQVKIDSIKSSAYNDFHSKKQTKSDNESGIEIKNVKFPRANEYSSYDAIKFSYKNNTGKDIEAISFSWYDLKDVFGDPLKPTYNGGYDDYGLRKGATGYGTWDLLEKKVKSGKVYVSKIAFKDGTVWKNE